jgi:hypothetical protein
VEEGVRGVTRPQTAALVLGLVAAFALAMVAGVGGSRKLQR